MPQATTEESDLSAILQVVEGRPEGVSLGDLAKHRRLRLSDRAGERRVTTPPRQRLLCSLLGSVSVFKGGDL
jgi:hypothetical protein